MSFLNFNNDDPVARYFHQTLTYATPVLLACVVIYYTVGMVSARLATSRRQSLQNESPAQRRQRALKRLDKKKEESDNAANSEEKKDKETKKKKAAPSYMRPRLPASSSNPFGSNTTAFADVRERFAGPSSSCCKTGGCG